MKKKPKNRLYHTVIPSGILMILMAIAISGCQSGDFNSGKSLLDVGFENDTETKVKTPTADEQVKKLLGSTAKTHYGLDISHFQGNLMEVINPRDSIKFIFCKATQGTTFLDPEFRTNWRLIQSKGFIRGTYHFYNCGADPIKQADFFTAQIKDIGQHDIPPVLDIEGGSMVKGVSAYQMEQDILKFLKQVEKNTGRKPIIYTNYEFAQENLKNQELADYQLWLAEYNNDKRPLVPSLWKEKGFLIWQKSASYNAYSRQIDLDVMFGSIEKIIE